MEGGRSRPELVQHRLVAQAHLGDDAALHASMTFWLASAVASNWATRSSTGSASSGCRSSSLRSDSMVTVGASSDWTMVWASQDPARG